MRVNFLKFNEKEQKKERMRENSRCQMWKKILTTVE
jgi:hypothetical protein